MSTNWLEKFATGERLRLLRGALARGALGALAWLATGCGETRSCEPEATTCQGLCVDLQSDDTHCGACGQACGTGEVCTNGTCEPFCVAGRKLCAGSCQGVQSNPDSCGSCDQACAGDFYCDQGVCSAACSGVLCPGTDGQRVCTHFDSDPDHCGSCENSCQPGFACEQGACIASCAPGRVSCGNECVDPLHSAVHCGSCGNTCNPNVACVLGVCADQERCDGEDCDCPPGSAACSGSCIDVKTNPYQCGACDSPCPGAQSCVAGECACPGSKSLCGDACVELDSNKNCGTCGNACASGGSCDAGQCTCPAGQDACDGLCVDLSASKKHCGACGVICSNLESCDDGVCFYEAEDGCGGRAVDLDITQISLFQVVEVRLFADGAAVPVAERNADIIAGKDALLRVHVDVGDDFEARSLSARLILTKAGADPVLLYKRLSVGSDSVQAELNSTFNIDIPGALLDADTTFHVELVECGGPAEPATGTTRFPQVGEGALQAVRAGAIQVVFVPILYNNILPDTSPSTLQAYADEVLRMYGTTSVEWDVTAPYGNESGPVDMDHLIDDLMVVKRAADAPADSVYYYGLFQPTETYLEYCPVECDQGIAYLPEGQAEFRVGVGIAYADAESRLTFAHELGHNHEREHAPCGLVDDTDSNWPQDPPYAGARIGSWGFDMTAGLLKDPAHTRDMMGYCQPAWVSDYTYEGINTVIQSVQKAAYRRGALPEPWNVLRVSSRQVRWLDPVPFLPPSGKLPDVGVVYDQAGQELERVTVYRFRVADGAGYRLLVPPPEPGWYAIGLLDNVALPYP